MPSMSPAMGSPARHDGSRARSKAAAAAAHCPFRCWVGATTTRRASGWSASQCRAAVRAKVVLPAPGVATARKSTPPSAPKPARLGPEPLEGLLLPGAESDRAGHGASDPRSDPPTTGASRERTGSDLVATGFCDEITASSASRHRRWPNPSPVRSDGNARCHYRRRRDRRRGVPGRRRRVAGRAAAHRPARLGGDHAGRSAGTRAWSGSSGCTPPAYAGIHWPVEYGGQGLTVEHHQAWMESCADAGVPPFLNMVGLVLAGGSLLLFGTEEQKRAHLAEHRPRRPGLVPAVLRARRRLRPRLAPDQRRARRRRVGRQRPEGVVLGRPGARTGGSCSPAPTATSPRTRASRSS